MSVYVRLSGGQEDKYPTQRVEVRDGYWYEGDEWSSSGWVDTSTTQPCNPSVRETKKGKLEVSFGGKILGKYPKGAWTSWRSD